MSFFCSSTHYPSNHSLNIMLWLSTPLFHIHGHSNYRKSFVKLLIYIYDELLINLYCIYIFKNKDVLIAKSVASVLKLLDHVFILYEINKRVDVS